MRITRGTQILLHATYRSLQSGAMVDPTTVTLTLLPPDGESVTKTLADGDITRSSRGVFEFVYTPPADGHYDFRWETTSPASAREGFFEVESYF